MTVLRDSALVLLVFNEIDGLKLMELNNSIINMNIRICADLSVPCSAIL